MATRPKNSAEAWVADIERKAAEGSLWEETPPVAERLADHFARLDLTDAAGVALDDDAAMALAVAEFRAARVERARRASS